MHTNPIQSSNLIPTSLNLPTADSSCPLEGPLASIESKLFQNVSNVFFRARSLLPALTLSSK